MICSDISIDKGKGEHIIKMTKGFSGTLNAVLVPMEGAIVSEHVEIAEILSWCFMIGTFLIMISDKG